MSLLFCIEQKQERWEEAVNSIDFSHSRHKALSSINKLTGRSGLSPVPPVASQQVKNGAQKKTAIRKSIKLTNKELSNQWKVSTPEGNSIAGPFRPEELAAALRCLKPGKSLGPDSIFPEYIFHARLALKPQFCAFLTFCLCQLKIPKIWRQALIVVIQSWKSHWGTQRAIALYLFCVSPSRSLRDSPTLVSNQTSTHHSHRSRQIFDTGGRQ